MRYNLKKGLLFILLIAIVSFALAFLNNQMITNTITGEVVSDILNLDKTTFTTGERITGDLRIRLEDADLIPYTTVVNLLIGQEYPAIPVDPDEVQYSPGNGNEEGENEGEASCYNIGECCYPSTGVGYYYGNQECPSPISDCWSSCTEIKSLTLRDFISLSNNPRRGELIFGVFNNTDGPSPPGQGYGFSGCNLDLSQCEIYGGQCATSCDQGTKEGSFSCSVPTYPGDDVELSPPLSDEGEPEGEAVCCIPNSYDTACELAGGVCAESCGFGYEESSLSCGQIREEGELLCCAKQYTCDGWSNAYTTAISNFNLFAPSSVDNYILTMEIKSSNVLSSTILSSSLTTFATSTPGSGSGNGNGDGNGNGNGSGGRGSYCGDSRCTGIETSITCPQDCGEEGTNEDIITREDDSGTDLKEEEKKDLWFYYILLPIIIIVVVALILILYFRKRGKESENIQKVKSTYPRFTQTIQRKPS